MTARVSEVIRGWLGWCPNAPVMHAAPAVHTVPAETAHPARPGGGTTGGPARIRRGIHIASGSMKTMFRDKRLFWFSGMAGLVILFLIAAETWTVAHIQSSLPFLASIPFMDSLVIDTRLFLLQLICFSGITMILAALVRYRSQKDPANPLSIREAFAALSPHTVSLTALSVILALAGTVLEAVVTQTPFFGKITFGAAMTVFYLPYAYYLPNELNSALFFSGIIIAINTLLVLLALYVIPLIVLGDKGLLPALAGSVALMRKTWREVLGCIFVFGAAIIGIAAVALIIGQSPLLLNHDYDFFLSLSRGKVLMTVVCYGFILACGVLVSIGSTVLGISIAGLYDCGSVDAAIRMPEPGIPGVEPAR